jgi:hypothetical protein
MRRFACLTCCVVAIAAACPVLSLGSDDVREINLTVARGWARQADGTIKDLTGMVFPATIERIETRPVSLKNPLKNKVRRDLKKTGFGRFMDQVNAPLLGPAPSAASYFSGPTVYQADAGAGYAIIDPEEFTDPASLDDLLTVGAAGKQWETLQFGFHTDAVPLNPAFTFVNWKGFSTYNSGTAAPASAFTGMFTNFAVLLPASQVPGNGSWKLTINVLSAGVVSPNNTMYVSQQFWLDNEDNYDTRFRNVYNAGAAPTVGSSGNQFWFDWDPQDENFANNELDVLSGEGSFSNHLRTLTVVDSGGGQTDTLVPFSVTFPVGFNPTGTFIDLWNADNTYVTIQRGITLNPTIAPMQIEMEGLAQVTTATLLKFHVEAGTTTGGSQQKVYLFNYTTNQYDLVDTRTSTSSDSAFDVTVASNPARYINQSNKRVKSLITFTAIISLNSQWNARVDQANWIVTR